MKYPIFKANFIHWTAAYCDLYREALSYWAIKKFSIFVSENLNTNDANISNAFFGPFQELLIKVYLV